MGKRISDWYTAASRAIRNWFLDVIDTSGCRKAERTAADELRCVIVNAHCQDQKCEKITMGRHGSPGPVQDVEKVYRILIAPVDIDMTTEQITLTAITHSETIGMSVLREQASDQEFRNIVVERTSKNGRVFFAVAEFDCGAIRSLRSARDEPGRLQGDRHFFIVDTDVEDIPFHADVFNTAARQDQTGKPTNKSVWRRERGQLLQLANNNVVDRAAFRQGRI